MFESFFKKASHGRLPVQSGRLSQGRERFFSDARKYEIGLSEKFQPPKLEILEEIASGLSLEKNNELDMSNTGLIGVQHMLPSTASLFGLINKYLKIKRKNMFFAGKFYSSCPEVEDYILSRGIHLMPTKFPKKHSMYKEHIEETMSNMWEKFIIHLEKNKNINKIIILDEGGHCLKVMPKYLPYKYEIAAIEQTRFGLYDIDFDSQLFPLIDVARSAAKRELESPLIASAITSRVSSVLQNLEINKDKICGVIGNGAIGSAVTKYLLAQGYTVNVYDESESSFQGIYNRSFYRVPNIKRVISASDIVFSCTGKDISEENDILSFVKGAITLVSCTSQNIEFLTLLKKATKDEHLVKTIGKNMSQLQYVDRDKEINILESGFPINFDRTPKSDPVKDMELTRCLLYCAIAQASFFAKKPTNDGVTQNDGCIQMLDPNMQRLIVNKWIVNQPKNRYSEKEIECFNDINWIKGNSGGEYKENMTMDSFFNKDEKKFSGSSNRLR